MLGLAMGPKAEAPGSVEGKMAGLGPYYQVNNIANKQQSIKESTYKTIHAYHNQTKPGFTAWGPTRGPAD